MVGWGHWIGCLHLLVALARPTPESGTEEHGLRQQRKHAQTADRYWQISSQKFALKSLKCLSMSCVPHRTVCSISSEKNHLCRNMATRIGGETTWLLGLYPAQRSLPVMFLQRVVIWDMGCVALKDWSESLQSPLESCGQDLLLPCLQQDSRLGPSLEKLTRCPQPQIICLALSSQAKELWRRKAGALGGTDCAAICRLWPLSHDPWAWRFGTTWLRFNRPKVRFKHVETLAKVWQCLPWCSSTGAAKEVLRHWFLLQAAGSKEGIGTRSGAASEPSRHRMRLVANITRLIMRVVAQDLVVN